MEVNADVRVIEAFYDPRWGVVVIVRTQMWLSDRLLFESCRALVYRAHEQAEIDALGAYLRETYGNAETAGSYN